MTLRSLLVVFLFSLILFRPQQGSAQDCATSLARAARSLDAGALHEVIEILTPCVQSMNLVEQEQAYRLLALAHLFRNEHQAADSAINAVLLLDPKYPRDTARDYYELVEAMSPYDWYPEWSITTRFGVNRALPNVIRPYTLQITPVSLSDRQVEYSGSVGVTFGLGLSYHLSKVLSLDVEASLRSLAFSRVSETGYKFLTTYHENLSHYVFPIVARLELPFRLGTIAPYLEGGAYAALLSGATSSVSATDEILAQSPSISAILSANRRKPSSFGLLIGTGASIESGSFQFGAALRYSHDLTDIVDGSQRYSQSDLTNQYYYIDDDFSLRNFEFSLTASYSLNFRSYKRGSAE